jgi:hypothetical protein
MLLIDRKRSRQQRQQTMVEYTTESLLKNIAVLSAVVLLLRPSERQADGQKLMGFCDITDRCTVYLTGNNL